MSHVLSFQPVIDSASEVLILGSMPGVISLKEGRYYAHPRNLFWKITGEIIGFDPALPYEQRISALVGSGIALWDVFHSCIRLGSLDAAIEAESAVLNDFVEFFAEHPRLRLVCFNGAKAADAFEAGGVALPGSVKSLRLPSTSPANASIPYARKLEAWRSALRPA